MEIVLSIAGSDSSAGAGIQQDLKTITSIGCYAATVVTAITSQNTLGVKDVFALPGNVVASQIQAVFEDLDVKAIKIGQIPNLDVAHAIADTLKKIFSNNYIPIIYDPVMISTSGRRLMEQECIGYICDNIFPLCKLVTPNIPETQSLLNNVLHSPDDLYVAGHKLVKLYQSAFLIKGGHSNNQYAVDRLFMLDGSEEEFSAKKVVSKNLHGTGCTLSSAIASFIAKGFSISEAVSKANVFVNQAIIRSINHGIGCGNGPLLVN